MNGPRDSYRKGRVPGFPSFEYRSNSVEDIESESSTTTDDDERELRRMGCPVDISKEYHSIKINGEYKGVDTDASSRLGDCLLLRGHYYSKLHPRPTDAAPLTRETLQYVFEDGIVVYTAQNEEEKPISYEKYSSDVKKVFETLENGPTRSLARTRLHVLETKFHLHSILNTDVECTDKFRKGGDLYSAIKVDNNVRLTTCANPRMLRDFIATKMRQDGDSVIDKANNITLNDMLTRFGIQNPSQLTVEMLGVQPGPQKLFHRFDMFNPEFSRGGANSALLLQIFLRRTFEGGRLLAELAKKVLERNHTECPTVATEYKLPVFGMHQGEWAVMAKWVTTHGLNSYPRNRWVIQIPRIDDLRVFMKCKTLQEQLDHLFIPLWEATLRPEENAEIAEFIGHVGAFNIICEENMRGQEIPATRRIPSEWPWEENPPDLLFNYYVWANLVSLNSVRNALGLNTFQYRPNCGELGGHDNGLVSAFLLADSVIHGIRLGLSPVLQYLYFVDQIGVSVSPLSNNGLHKEYYSNPFPSFFRSGLRVSLSTDDPLHYHYTYTPLQEEYGTAAKLYKLSSSDMCEIARNSVVISAFPEEQKKIWLGENYMGGSTHNAFNKSNVPSIRLHFREQMLMSENRILGRESAEDSDEEVPDANIGEESFDGLQTSRSQMKNFTRRLEKVEFQRIEISGPDDPKTTYAADLLREAYDLRRKYMWSERPPWEPKVIAKQEDVETYEARMVDGIVEVRKKNETLPQAEYCRRYSIDDFFRDYERLSEIVNDNQVQLLSERRLNILELKYILHTSFAALFNYEADDNRDFYQAYKVDNSVKMDAAVAPKELLAFVTDLVTKRQNDIVDYVDGTAVTLRDWLESNGVVDGLADTHDVNVETAAVIQACQNSRMRSLILGTDNYTGGRLFADLCKTVFARAAQDPYIVSECSLTIYGKSRDEWKSLSRWYTTHGASSTQNKYCVFIPFSYRRLRSQGLILNLQNVLDNLFLPLWAVTLDPHADPYLAHFIKRISSFIVSETDDVDEYKDTNGGNFTRDPPKSWTRPITPPFHYVLYYIATNLQVLNEFRRKYGLNTFRIKSRCGYVNKDHLTAAYLLCNTLSHSLQLTEQPSVQYLCYLSRLSLSLCPIADSNNGTVLYSNHPLLSLFRRGVEVSVATDAPLVNHRSKEPLIEEYALAAKLWALSTTDMCELALNSVRISALEDERKAKMHGEFYYLRSSLGNRCEMTRVPDVRIAYRFEAYHSEMDFLESVGQKRDLFVRTFLMPHEEERMIARSRASVNPVLTRVANREVGGIRRGGASSFLLSQPEVFTRTYSMVPAPGISPLTLTEANLERHFSTVSQRESASAKDSSTRPGLTSRKDSSSDESAVVPLKITRKESKKRELQRRDTQDTDSLLGESHRSDRRDRERLFQKERELFKRERELEMKEKQFAAILQQERALERARLQTASYYAATGDQTALITHLGPKKGRSKQANMRSQSTEPALASRPGTSELPFLAASFDGFQSRPTTSGSVASLATSNSDRANSSERTSRSTTVHFSTEPVRNTSSPNTRAYSPTNTHHPSHSNAHHFEQRITAKNGVTMFMPMESVVQAALAAIKEGKKLTRSPVPKANTVSDIQQTYITKTLAKRATPPKRILASLNL